MHVFLETVDMQYYFIHQEFYVYAVTILLNGLIVFRLCNSVHNVINLLPDFVVYKLSCYVSKTHDK